MRVAILLSIFLFTGGLLSPVFAADPASPQREVMTPMRMVEILRAAADESKALPHMVMLKYKGIELRCIYDERHDRMRIIAPVAARADISDEQFEKAMEANFHTSLDARYALNKGILFAAFIHPLSPLTPAQIESALVQTATLTATFGKQYSSGSLTFQGGGKPL